MSLRWLAAVLLLPLTAAAAHAGLYCSEESFAELPAQWRGFLIDQRQLRGVAVPGSPARVRYEQAAERLTRAARDRPLSADEAADLGALRLRLGDLTGALAVLVPAQRAHPTHFRLAANLGTAWQFNGDLAQAAAVLEQAVRLAPGRCLRAEELHLKLVRLRLREPKGAQDLDDLFGVHFVGPGGKYEAGRLDAAEVRKLPADAVANAQQLALWLPTDGRLLWLLAELAAAGGDVGSSAALFDSCVSELGLRPADLREHRNAVRTLADERAREINPGDRTVHDGHALTFKPHSSRPLAGRSDTVPLPPIDPKGVNALPWSVLAQTKMERPFRPAFVPYLKELEGKEVTLTGHMQPLGDDNDCAAFLFVEFPVGCWFCEMPALTDIVLVEMAEGQTQPFTRAPLCVTGRLVLNASDPERFLYVIRQARVTPAP